MAVEARDDATRVRTLLRAELQAPDDALGEVRPLAGGVFSRAYACHVGGREYVVRLNRAAHAVESFAKDAYAWRHFASAQLPIPRVIASGLAGSDAWAISDRVAGRTLEQHTHAERRALLPATLDMLDIIRQADTSASRGYGEWGADGNARWSSWRAYLAGAIENETAGYYQNWHTLFRESFLERDVFEAVYRTLLRLAQHCPKERVLIHTDYHFENILAAEQRITGVLDWGSALYGDGLYDVARLAWWSAQPGWWHADGAELMRARYGVVPRYDERIACCQCHMGLGDLRYYAKNGKRPEYEFFRARLLALIAKWPHE